ncbi:MAG TPA: phosphotransferase [Planctomycetaceae bacterium]|nr:phosphotransferase [Planctomycetaceae bacterium]
MVPAPVLAAFGWEDAQTQSATSGLINETYFVVLDGRRHAVLQQLHPVFGPTVNLDLEAVTEHLAKHGLVTPRLIRTAAGEAWAEHDAKYWRAITYVPGRTFEQVPSIEAAQSAGELIGRFHRAMADFDREFAHVRTGVHDTAAHVAKLATLRGSHSLPEIDALAAEILHEADRLFDFSNLPVRPCHGDLKISNVLFSSDSHEAICLIDLDTNAMQLVAHEMGDALRSWCNPHPEDSDCPEVSLDILSAAIHGYARGSAGLLSLAEQASIAPGFQTIPIELAARFCADAYEDKYFGWDASRYPSRRAHNLARAKSQLRLGQAVHAARSQIDASICAAF